MAGPALLLDLDGTLWDSRPWFAQILAQLSGHSLSELEQRQASGANIVRLADECGVSRTRFARQVGDTSESLSLYDGALQTLETLKGRGTSIGVVTNLPARLVTPMTEGTQLDRYFDTVVTPQPFNGIPAKPSPRGIHVALQRMCREAGPRTWFAGDGAVDAKAARAAGLSFAWASYGYEAEPPPGTNLILARLDDLLEL